MYKSNETVVHVRKQVLTELSHKTLYSWNCEIRVDVDSKKEGVVAKVFIFPDIAADDKSITTLLVSTAVQQSVLKKLHESHEDSWVVVETEVMDRRAGRRLDFMEYEPHKIQENGKVNFYQNLLSCNEVRHTPSENVDLMITVTFITSPR